MFVDQYTEARERFLEAAEALGASVYHFENPFGKGPAGETLAADAAWIGPDDAERVLLCLSGVHGVEGAAGSSAQLAWMRSDNARTLPPSVAVFMVHAVNPWGYAYTSRFNENNVDLNRNFIEHQDGYPENPHYPVFHDIVAVPDLQDSTLQTMRAETRTFARSLGRIDARIAMNGGQADFQDGTSYAGGELQWSNALLKDLSLRFLKSRKYVCLIDWHTGYGEYGEVCFLSKLAMRRQCATWWGDERFSITRRSKLPPSPKPRPQNRPLAPGQFRDALPKLLPDTAVTGATIEFGSIQQQGDWLYGRVFERWLAVHGDRESAAAKPLLQRIRRVFISDEPAWRQRILFEGHRVTQQAVVGLSHWQEPNAATEQEMA